MTGVPTVTFLGADTQQLRETATTMAQRAQEIDALRTALRGAVDGVAWTGPDADAFRALAHRVLDSRAPQTVQRISELAQLLQQEAEEQDTTSDSDGEGSTGPDRTPPLPTPPVPPTPPIPPLRDRSSDGFWGDLLGGPESGYLGSMAWNGVSVISDVAGLVGIGAPDAVNAALDFVSLSTGLYDAAQSFQDGELYNTADGLVTASVNGADIAFTALQNSGVPPAVAVGTVGSLVTGALDAGWSGLTMLAQTAGLDGGPGNGSTSRFLLEMPSWSIDHGIEALTGIDLPIHETTQSVLDGAEDIYGAGTRAVRSVLPIDPALDGVQDVVSYGAEHWWPGLEEKAKGVNDVIRSILPG